MNIRYFQEHKTYNYCRIKLWRLWKNLKKLKKIEGSQEIPWKVWKGLEWQMFKYEGFLNDVYSILFKCKICEWEAKFKNWFEIIKRQSIQHNESISAFEAQFLWYLTKCPSILLADNVETIPQSKVLHNSTKKTWFPSPTGIYQESFLSKGIMLDSHSTRE